MKLQLKKSIFFVMVVSSVSTAYDFKCADESHRKIRANWYCNTTEENYSCLLDFSHKSYRESCSYESDFVRMGQKYVIKGSKRNVNCSANTYQPFKFYSSKLSKCAFLKSSCTEEGQIIFANDSTMEDSKCSCDYTKGYIFLVRPRDNRYCLPDQEDCTCYNITCPIHSVLTSDYECSKGHTPPSVSPASVHANSNKNEAVEIIYWDSFPYNLALPTKLYKMAAAAASTVCLISLVVIVIVVNYNHHLLMGCNNNDEDEIDGNQVVAKEDDTNDGKYDEKGEPVDRNNYVNENDIANSIGQAALCNMEKYSKEHSLDKLNEHSALCTKDEDATKERIIGIIGDLEKTIQKFYRQYKHSIFQYVRSKGLHREDVLYFLGAVYDIVKEKNEINLVEGVKLIKIITDTCTRFSEDDSCCMQIPIEILQCIWNKRVEVIEHDDKSPHDLNSDMAEIRKKFETLDKNLSEKDCILKTFTDDTSVFVVKLQQRIYNLIKNKVTCTEKEVNRVTHESHTLINLYMNVQFLRSAYCIRYYSRDVTSTRDKLHIMFAELNDIDASQKEFLKVFAKPTDDTIAFFALFHPSKYDFFSEYMGVKGCELQDLSNILHGQKFAMRSQKWPEYWANMSFTPQGTMWSTKSDEETEKVLLKFELIPKYSKGDNIFLISSNRWPSWYMYLNEASCVRGDDKRTSHKREWKILRLENGTYVMCTRKWPSKFIFMDNGNMGKVIAAYGDPGENGLWHLIHENALKI